MVGILVRLDSSIRSRPPAATLRLQQFKILFLIQSSVTANFFEKISKLLSDFFITVGQLYLLFLLNKPERRNR
jgi:hypothetical protein